MPLDAADVVAYLRLPATPPLPPLTPCRRGQPRCCLTHTLRAVAMSCHGSRQRRPAKWLRCRLSSLCLLPLRRLRRTSRRPPATSITSPPLLMITPPLRRCRHYAAIRHLFTPIRHAITLRLRQHSRRHYYAASRHLMLPPFICHFYAAVAAAFLMPPCHAILLDAMMLPC